jgi:hypothetical protein
MHAARNIGVLGVVDPRFNVRFVREGKPLYDSGKGASPGIEAV